MSRRFLTADILRLQNAFVEKEGREPTLGYAPLSSAQAMAGVRTHLEARGAIPEGASHVRLMDPRDLRAAVEKEVRHSESRSVLVESTISTDTFVCDATRFARRRWMGKER